MGVLVDPGLQADVVHFLGLDEDASPTCFGCGQQLFVPIVFWHGNSERPLTLHPSCAVGLSVRLIGDSQAAEAADRASRRAS